jgi:hypothetical protein
MEYHYNGLRDLEYIKGLDIFDKFRLYMHLLIESEFSLNRYSLQEFVDKPELFCHYASALLNDIKLKGV